MNLAELSHKSIKGRRLDAVVATPPLIENSKWRDVTIECRSRSSDLAGVTFRDCSFNDCYFGNAKLDLRAVRFESCTFREVTFMFGHLVGASFVDCLLRDTYLRSARLCDARFQRSKLVSVSLENADLTGCRFGETSLEQMENWGWHGYQGAVIPDEQKFKYFITTDPGPRLRAALAQGAPLPPAHRLLPFIDELEAKAFATGELMLLHSEWQDVVSFPDFVAIGIFLTSEPPPNS